MYLLFFVVVAAILLWRYWVMLREKKEQSVLYAEQGIIAMKRGNYNSALMNYSKALRCKKSVELYYGLILCLVNLERKDEARIMIQKGFKYCRKVQSVTKVDETKKLLELKRKYNL